MKNVLYSLFLLLAYSGYGQSGDSIDLQVCIRQWCSGSPVADVDFNFNPQPLVPATLVTDPGSDAQGCWVFESAFDTGTVVQILPYKNDLHLNGVTVWDFWLVARHILGLEILPSPYAMIAADINKSGTITSFDLVEMRKLMLGVYSELPNNTSWRFVDANFAFPNPINPFTTQFPESPIIDEPADTIYNFDLVAIKVGDVDCSAGPGAAPEGNDRFTEPLVIKKGTIQNGIFRLPVFLEKDTRLNALQFSLHFDPEALVIKDVISAALGEGLEWASPQPGELNLVWVHPDAKQIGPGQALAYIEFQAESVSSDCSSLQEGIRLKGLAVTDQMEQMDLHLEFTEVQPPSSNVVRAYPNPITEGATLEIRAAQAAPATLEIRDAFGGLQWEKQWQAAKGFEPVVIPEEAFPQKGIYFYFIQVGNERYSGQLIRI
ncbi:MAG: hypothetical protein R2792_11580 [Saprospiraceae bacterium]